MIEYIHELENEDGYRRYSNFQISDKLKDLLHKDYYLYNSKDFKRNDEVEALYEKNFLNKYDRDTQAEIFQLYIDNKAFKDKALFVYSLIDFNKYQEFVKNNEDIDNPNDYTITYNIVDSSGVKVTMYNISIVDISFVF